MTLKKTFVSVALIGAATLLLAGCSPAAPGSASSPAAKPSESAPAASAQPFNVGGLLAGNASPTVDAGEPGKVSVVAEGPLVKPGIGASLLFAFRNNTSAAISHVDFSATARLDGKLVASGASQGTIPAQVQPGEIGLGYIYFDDSTSMPDTGLKYEFTAETLPADTSSYNTAPLKVSEANNNGSSIVGTAVNKTGKGLTGPYSVQVYCFEGNDITAQIGGFADQSDDITDNAQVSFTVDLYDTKCDTFALGVSGYFK